MSSPERAEIVSKETYYSVKRDLEPSPERAEIVSVTRRKNGLWFRV